MTRLASCRAPQRLARHVGGVVAALLVASGAASAQTMALPVGVRSAPASQYCAMSLGGCLLSTTDKPEIRPERVAGELVAGTYAGVAGYFIGRGVGVALTGFMADDQDQLRENIVNGVGMVGGTFAIGGAIYAIGNIGAETGSFEKTMGGVAIGSATSLIISRLVFKGHVPADKWSARRKWWVATLECSLPAIGGTIAFNRSRRWER